MGFANCQLPMMSHNVFVLTAALLCAINVTATPVTDITAPTTYEGAKSIVWDRFAEDRRASNASNGTIAPTSAPTVAGPIVSFTLSLSDVSLVQFDTAFEMAYVNTLATGLTNATGVNVSTSQIYDVKASALRRAAGISVSQKISLPSGTTASVATDFATSTHAYLVTDFGSHRDQCGKCNSYISTYCFWFAFIEQQRPWCWMDRSYCYCICGGFMPLCRTRLLLGPSLK